mgnify:CR=1 FL=1
MEEKLVQALNESRMINSAENVIFPLMETMIAQRLELACAEFRGGKTDLTAHIAYIAGLKDLINSMKRIQTNGNIAHQKLNEK